MASNTENNYTIERSTGTQTRKLKYRKKNKKPKYFKKCFTQNRSFWWTRKKFKNKNISHFEMIRQHTRTKYYIEKKKKGKDKHSNMRKHNILIQMIFTLALSPSILLCYHHNFRLWYIFLSFPPPNIARGDKKKSTYKHCTVRQLAPSTNTYSPQYSAVHTVHNAQHLLDNNNV